MLLAWMKMIWLSPWRPRAAVAISVVQVAVFAVPMWQLLAGGQRLGRVWHLTLGVVVAAVVFAAAARVVLMLRRWPRVVESATVTRRFIALVEQRSLDRVFVHDGTGTVFVCEISTYDQVKLFVIDGESANDALDQLDGCGQGICTGRVFWTIPRSFGLVFTDVFGQVLAEDADGQLVGAPASVRKPTWRQVRNRMSMLVHTIADLGEVTDLLEQLCQARPPRGR